MENRFQITNIKTTSFHHWFNFINLKKGKNSTVIGMINTRRRNKRNERDDDLQLRHFTGDESDVK